MIDFKDLFFVDTLKGQAKRYLETFIREPLALRLKAEPGWRVVLFAPDGDDVFIDIVPFEEWGMFTSLQFPEETDAEYRDGIMLRKNQEATMPVIPSAYILNTDNPISNYFKRIQDNYPEWNRVPPPSLIFGCVSPSNNKTVEDIKPFIKKMYNSLKTVTEKADSIYSSSARAKSSVGDLSNSIQDIFGSLKKNDKSKLN